MNEFSLIEQFFKSIPTKRKDVLFGIGDDAAAIDISNENTLLVSTDTLVSGVHFLPEWNPYDIACKALMTNISDMAAMAAEPCWITLALTLPEFDPSWLSSFAKGLEDSLALFNIALIGGDTTRGPLSITITIMGVVPKGKSIKRGGAKAGDVILVSGQLGGAALAVKLLHAADIEKQDKDELMHKLLHPKPRTDLISVLRTYASAAIDISDGLSADLNHICIASDAGACINEEEIPLHPLLKKYCKDRGVDLALSGGDDYELCFTVPEQKLDGLMAEIKKAGLTCYPVGVIENESGMRIKTADNQVKELSPKGYTHF